MNKLKKYYRYEHKNEWSDEFILKEVFHLGPWKNDFSTPEEATTHFEEAEKLANEKYKQIIEGMKKLKESVGDFSYNYYMEGDRAGIDYSGLVIEFNINGYDFTFDQDC